LAQVGGYFAETISMPQLVANEFNNVIERLGINALIVLAQIMLVKAALVLQ